MEKIADLVKFPLHALEKPESLVPQLPVRRFLQTVSEREGDRLFGLRTAQVLSFQKMATVSPMLKNCTDLLELLQRFCQTVHLQSDLCFYLIKESRDFIWLGQSYPRLPSDTEQIELFQLAGMIHLVRSVAGANWLPPQIHLRSSKNIHTENANELNLSKITFSQPWIAIAIQRKLLGMPLVPGWNKEAESGLDKVTDFPELICERLTKVLSPYLGIENLNQGLAAEITGMSFRTLQRYLARADTSYSSMIDQIRFREAKKLLKGSEQNLLDICLQLGYDNASSFTRAFRRWSGISPSAYRKQYILG